MSGDDKRNRLNEEEAKMRFRKRSVVFFSSILVVLLIAAIFYMVYSDQRKDQVKPHKQPMTHRVTQTVQINYADEPFIGRTDAPVKLAVFSDYRCPYCKIFDQQILPQIVKKYVGTGKVSIYFYNYTILGPGSDLAANAAEEIYQQNPRAFYAFNQALFQAQGSEKTQWVTKPLLVGLAKKTVPSLDVAAFENILNTKSKQSSIDDDNQMAEELGVPGTPTILINGKISQNELSFSHLQREIDHALKKS